MNASPNQPLHGALPRSPQLLGRETSVLLVVDAQEKLVELMATKNQLLFNISRLLDAANILGIQTLATEQYPERLGPTHPDLQDKLPTPDAKRAFSCGECGSLFQPLAEQGVHQVVVCGLETHVCVLQTALDLMASGFSVHLVADALASRGSLDREIALRRMESSGGTLTTTETVLFEWCETSTAEGFKQISQLVKQAVPDA